MLFKNVGYYICEVVNIEDTDDMLHEIGNKILSVGITNHPHISEYFYKGLYISDSDFEEKKARYRSKLKLSGKLFDELLEETSQMYDSRMDTNGRFVALSDAKYFHDKYFSAIDCKVISVSAPGEFYESLKSEMQRIGHCKTVSGDIDDYPLLGYDILGWDHGGFYTFLEYELHKALPEAKFNDLGLLENPFDTVAEFADKIQGMGEPVIWTPCRIGDCGN